MSSESPTHDDLDLARAVENVLWWTGYWRRNEIAVSVDRGWVTLSGTVDWDYQKRTAVHALKDMPGIAGIIDRLVISFDPNATAPVRADEPGPTLDRVTRSRWS